MTREETRQAWMRGGGLALIAAGLVVLVMSGGMPGLPGSGDGRPEARDAAPEDTGPASSSDSYRVDEGAPLIHFKEDSFSFGRIGQEKTVRHVFRFVNAGRRPLVIEKVRSS